MRFLPLALMIFLVGCSRTSHDKDEAFYAIFRVAPDASVTVRQGKLWENRHFVFYEYYALVEFEASEEKVQSLMNNMKTQFQPFDATGYGFGQKEDERWFAPDDGSKYFGWRSGDGVGVIVIRSSKTQRVYALRSEL